MLVDGDNASAATIGDVLRESSKYGSVIIRRVYGDWTTAQLGPWKKVLQVHAFSPIQQFPNVSGKNATDSSLIIDAMDILHGGKVRGFCIVSSDSDYTKLATRIREEGMFVLGIGKSSTPAAFSSACDVFVAVENLSKATVGPGAASSQGPTPPSGAGPTARPPQAGSGRGPRLETNPSAALELLRQALDVTAEEDGRAHLGALGAALQKIDPAFDPRTYGYSRLLTLIQMLPEEFVIDRPPDLSNPRIYVRLKSGSTAPSPERAPKR